MKQITIAVLALAAGLAQAQDTIATAIPGTFQSRAAFATYLSKAARSGPFWTRPFWEAATAGSAMLPATTIVKAAPSRVPIRARATFEAER